MKFLFGNNLKAQSNTLSLVHRANFLNRIMSLSKSHLILIFTLGTLVCKSQEFNYLSDTEFQKITLNGIKLEAIIDTHGDIEKMKGIFDANLSTKTSSEPVIKISFWNSRYYFSFNYDEGNEGFNLVRFKLKTNTSKITIMGITVSIGDNINKFPDAKITNFNDGSRGVIYREIDSDSSGIFFTLDPKTNIITQIEYNVFN